MERSILLINEVIWQTSQSGKSGGMTDTGDGGCGGCGGTCEDEDNSASTEAG